MKILDVFKSRSMNSSMAKQLIASFMFTSCIVYVISYFFIYYGIIGMLERQTEQTTIEQFKQAEYNIGNLLDETAKVSRLLISDDDIQSFITRKQETEVDKIALKVDIFKKLSDIISNYEYVTSINLYSGNGDIIGKTSSSNTYLEDQEKKSWFYRSEMYGEIIKGNMFSLWHGGYNQNDFDFLKLNKGIKDNHVLTFTQLVNSLSGGRSNAVLVLNIDEKFFTRGYNNNTSREDDCMYIIDENGRTISHSDQLQIGKRSESLSGNPLPGNSGSFTFQKSGVRKKILYMKLGRPNWTLVRELPYSVFIGSVLELRKTFLMVGALGIFSIFLIALYWIYRITKPLDKLLRVMSELEKGNLGVKMDKHPGNEFELLTNKFNRMSRSINDLVEKVKVIESKKRLLEIEALQAQINPHFIYNTLNTIKWRAIIAGENNIVDSLSTFGSLLQQVFRTKPIYTSLKEEIDYTEKYVKIMNYRYCEGVVLSVSMPSDIENILIPRFIFQPLVENAIIHGISTINGRIDITISVERAEDEFFIVKLTDNGKGIPEDKLLEIKNNFLAVDFRQNDSFRSIGLLNVHQKLRLQYGDNYGLDVSSKVGSGTTVSFIIPFVQKIVE